MGGSVSRVRAGRGRAGVAAGDRLRGRQGRRRRVSELFGNIWHQRTVYEVHPELSFRQLNDDRPMRHSKHKQAGMEERRALLEARVPGVERIIDARIPRVTSAHLLDATACLWTARRIFAHAVNNSLALAVSG